MKRICLALILRFLFGWLAAQGAEGWIQTVNGPISPSDLGKSLSHEHVLVDFIGAEETGFHRWDRDEVVPVVLPHLLRLKELGYRSLFECTPAFIGRDSVLLKRLSELSGLHLITNTGYYGARENLFIPKTALSQGPDQLAAIWIQEFEEGIGDTGIKPGFIKIGVDRDDELSAFHETLIRAAARTHLATGLTIASHTGASKSVFQQAAILKEEGVAAEAFIWVHATRDESENHIKAARMGMWVSIDNLRENAKMLEANAERLVALKEAGLLSRVLVSQDAGWYRPGEPGGGSFAPYAFVEENLIPALRKKGFTDSDVEQLLVTNPARAFQIGIRRTE